MVFRNQIEEELLINLPEAVSIRVSQGGVSGSGNAYMFQFECLR